MMMRFSHRLSVLALAAALIVSLTARPVRAGDQSFSSVVKHIKSTYNGKQQGFLGFVNLARFVVKVIKPAGVKNFKFALLHDLDYSRGPRPEDKEFHAFIRSRIDPEWVPLVQYSAPREKQWTYVYTTREKDDLKVLVVGLQKAEAFVLQTKFSPAKLVEFMNDPKIMGISLKDDKKQDPQQPAGPAAPPAATVNSDQTQTPPKQITFSPAELAALLTIQIR